MFENIPENSGNHTPSRPPAPPPTANSAPVKDAKIPHDITSEPLPKRPPPRPATTPAFDQPPPGPPPSRPPPLHHSHAPHAMGPGGDAPPLSIDRPNSIPKPERVHHASQSTPSPLTPLQTPTSVDHTSSNEPLPDHASPHSQHHHHQPSLAKSDRSRPASHLSMDLSSPLNTSAESSFDRLTSEPSLSSEVPRRPSPIRTAQSMHSGNQDQPKSAMNPMNSRRAVRSSDITLSMLEGLKMIHEKNSNFQTLFYEIILLIT